MSKLCNKKLLANSLLEWTLGSETTFIEAKDNQDLIDKAKKLGIILPSPDLAAFSTIYAEVDKFNLNGVKIPKEVAKKGIKTLVGKQINWNHSGAYQICGYIIDAELKENKIFITGILFKSLFKQEFDEVIQLFVERNLFVSFELWKISPDGKSIIKSLGNGYKELIDFIGHGCALLLLDPQTKKPIPPACPQAQVFKLLASEKLIQEAEQIINKVFEKDDRLVYAELSIEEKEPCNKCAKCTYEKEEPKLDEIYLFELAIDNVIELNEEEISSFENDYEGGEIEEAKKLKYEERQNLPDSDFAVVVTVKNKVTGKPRKIRMFPIQDEAHVRNALARLPLATETLKKLGVSPEEVKKKILKKAKELNMTELLKKYEKAEDAQVIVEPAKVELPIVDEPKVEVSVVEPIIEVKPVEATTEVPIVEVKLEPAEVVIPPVEVKAEMVTEQPVNPAKKLVKVAVEQTETLVNTYTDEVGSGVSSRKCHTKTIKDFDDGTQEVIESDSDYVTKYTLAELEEKVNAAKAEKDTEIATLKAEHERVLGEKDKEIKNKNEELDAKAQEIAKLTKPVEEATVVDPPILDVGAVTKVKEDKYQKYADEVNDKAYGKKIINKK